MQTVWHEALTQTLWGLWVVDSTRDGRALSPGTLPGEEIQRRSPEEQAVAESTKGVHGRVARYERRKREQGFRKTTFWVREGKLEALKAILRRLNAEDEDSAEVQAND